MVYTSNIYEGEKPGIFNPATVQVEDISKSSGEKKNGFCSKEAFRIIKPLIPLKLILFLWYGGGSAYQSYQVLYFKQRGLTIAQLSIINIINPAIQLLGPMITGLIADKIGKSKPVLVGVIMLVLLLTNCMMLIPQVSVKRNVLNSTLLQCNFNTSVTEVSPNVELNVGNCTLKCFNGSSEGVQDMIENEDYIDINDLDANHQAYSGDVHVVLTENLTSSLCGMTISENCNLVCTLDGLRVEDNTTFVFLIALVLIILFNTSFSCTYRILDVTSMSMVKTYNSDLGRERIWCVVGAIIMNPLTGYLLHTFTLENGSRNFVIIFYMMDVLIAMEILTVFKLEVQVEPPGKMMWKKTTQLLRNYDVCAFILTVVVLGTSWSFMRIFSPLYLDELGAPSIIHALVPTVQSVVGLPFLLTSNWFIKKIGSTNLLITAFVGYTIQCLGYSFLVNPWMSLIIEILNVFTYNLLWVAVVRHSHEIAPEGLTATVISTAGGIHYGLGRGTGSLIGGLVMHKYGGRQAFRVIAIMTAVSAVFLTAFSYFRGKYKKQLPEEVSAGIELSNSFHLEAKSVEASPTLKHR